MAISPYVIKSETDPKDVGRFFEEFQVLATRAACGDSQAEAVLDLSLWERGVMKPPLRELPMLKPTSSISAGLVFHPPLPAPMRFKVFSIGRARCPLSSPIKVAGAVGCSPRWMKLVRKNEFSLQEVKQWTSTSQ